MLTAQQRFAVEFYKRFHNKKVNLPAELEHFGPEVRHSPNRLGPDRLAPVRTLVSLEFSLGWRGHDVGGSVF